MSIFDDRARAVYVISVAAELANMHPQTLRLYERRGLVLPGRTRGGSRRYSEVDVHRLRRIQALTNEGLNLEGVRKVLELEDRIDALQHEVAMLEDENHRLNKQYKRELVPFAMFNTPLWGQRKGG